MAAVNLGISLVALALLPMALGSWSSDAAGYGLATGVLGFAALGAPLLRRLGATPTVSIRRGLLLVALGVLLVVPAPTVGWALVPLAVAGRRGRERRGVRHQRPAGGGRRRRPAPPCSASTTASSSPLRWSGRWSHRSSVELVGGGPALGATAAGLARGGMVGAGVHTGRCPAPGYRQVSADGGP